MPSTIQKLSIVLVGLCFGSLFTTVAHAQGDVTGVYTAKCGACHGADGSANTPAGKAVMAHDFHSAEVQDQTDTQLTATVASGKNKMPAYAKILKPDQIKALVDYCRALGKKK